MAWRGFIAESKARNRHNLARYLIAAIMGIVIAAVAVLLRESMRATAPAPVERAPITSTANEAPPARNTPAISLAAHETPQFRVCRKDGRCMTTTEPFRVCIGKLQLGSRPCRAGEPETQVFDGRAKGEDADRVLFAYQCGSLPGIPHCNPPATFRHYGARPPFDQVWTFDSEIKWQGETYWQFRLPNGALLRTPRFWAPKG